MILNVCGDYEALNSVLDDLEYISGVKILSMRDLEDGRGVLINPSDAVYKTSHHKISKEV